MRLKSRFLSILLTPLLLSSSVISKNKNVYFGIRTEDKKIALTFDDGPHPIYTRQILDVLSEYGVPATFFVIGENAEMCPELLTKEIAGGHEIGSHTYSHRRLCNMSENEIEKEIEKNNDIIRSRCGAKPGLFRPPEGVASEKVRKAAEKFDMPIILWSVDTEDWKGKKSSAIVDSVMNNVRPGSIVLFHDYVSFSSGTPDALKTIIPELQKEGYTFVTVSELLFDSD